MSLGCKSQFFSGPDQARIKPRLSDPDLQGQKTQTIEKGNIFSDQPPTPPLYTVNDKPRGHKDANIVYRKVQKANTVRLRVGVRTLKES